MAANKKAQTTVALQNGGRPYSLHHDLAGHFRMDGAVVGIRSGLGKRVRELFVRVHHLGLEHAVCAHGGMRNVLTVCPGNCCSDRYGDRLRPKNEIIDFTATFAAEGWSLAATRDESREQQQHRNHHRHYHACNPHTFCFVILSVSFLDVIFLLKP